jgi:hypothetical protein
MKKSNFILLVACLALSSCATVFGGQKTDHQVTRPECKEPKRQIRWAALVLDLTFPPALLIDFATRKIYKPQPRKTKLKKCHNQPTN